MRIFKKPADLKIPEKNEEKNHSLSSSLMENIGMLQQILHHNDMVIYKFFHEPNTANAKYGIVFVDTLSSAKTINDKIIRPVIHDLLDKEIKKEKLSDYIVNNVISCREIVKSTDLDFMVNSLLYGDTLFLIDGVPEALVINTREWVTRAITEPESERVVRGPKEGFTESLKVNISLIERKIINPDLKFQYMEIGNVTKTKVCICYLEGIASKKILAEVEKRLSDIKIDGILDSAYIQELIKDSPLSIFQTIGDTERPDIVAAKLLEGRIAMICDGSPSVLTVPYLFLEYFQANEDYYNNYVFSSINRLLRIFSLFLTTSIPAIYLAIVSFHQEMLPTPLMLSITTARKDVPFPTIVELILMLLVFEVMREAGVRLPQSIGMAISIVGALVLGDAAVNAKIVSAPIVIVTAFTGISAFLIYKMKGPVIVIRLFFMIAAAFLGLYGYMLCLMAMAVYLVSVRSFGVPYMLNTTVIDINGVKDTVVRAPFWLMNYRPKFAAWKAGARVPVKR